MKVQADNIPGPRIRIGDTSYLYFGGTAYLGAQTDYEFRKMLANFTLELGSHWGASRAGNLVLSVYEKTESALASWLGSEACLTLSSGFMAARLLVEYFAATGRPCFFSPNCHEALLPPGRKRIPDWKTLQRELEECLTEDGKMKPVVFTDTIGGNLHPGPIWETLKSLPQACTVVADDSHGLGICGSDGSGSWKALSELGFRELLLCSSLGKAMGITAGMIAGPAKILEALKLTPFFVGASPAPPSGLAALAKSLNNGFYLQQHLRLLENVEYFNQKVGNMKILKSYPGYPVFYFANKELAAHLFRSRIFITDFEYAAEAGTDSPKRIVLSAAHEKIHLDRLAEILNAF